MYYNIFEKHFINKYIIIMVRYKYAQLYTWCEVCTFFSRYYGMTISDFPLILTLYCNRNIRARF